MFKKISLTVMALSLIAVLVSQPALAQKLYRAPEPPGRTATTYIAGILGLADGSVSWDVKRDGEIFKYRITEVGNPQGFNFDINFLNNLIDKVVENTELRSDNAIRTFIEKSLYDEYEGLEEKVNDGIEKITGIKDFSAEAIEFGKKTEFTKDIEGLLGHEIDPKNDSDMGFLLGNINKLKKNIPIRSIRKNILFKEPLKETVNNYLKTYANENLNVTNDTHSGILSFFGEWASSLYNMGEDTAGDFEASIKKANNYISILTQLKDSIQSNIYKGANINIFNFLESNIPSYFADLKLTGSSIDEVKSKIAAFGERMDEISSDADLKQAIQNYAGDEFSNELVSRFAARVLGKSLSTEGAKVLRAWSKTVDDETAEDILFNPINRAKKLEIVREGRKDLSIDEVFNLDKNVYNVIKGEVDTTVKEWMVRLINDMDFVKDKVNERAKELGLGEDYIDITDPAHEATLISFAGRIVDLVDIDELGHSQARSNIAKEIAKLEKEDLQDLFPPAEQLASSSLPLQGASDTMGTSESDNGIGSASTPVFGQDNGLFNDGLSW